VRDATADENKEKAPPSALTSSDEPQVARCYRVEPCVGVGGIRPRERPEQIAPFTKTWLRVEDEFMVTNVAGSAETVQFLQMADGRGWVTWDRLDPRFRLNFTYEEFEVGKRIEARQRVVYGSGDVVQPGAQGVIERVTPLVGVRWDSLNGIKAVDRPRQVLRTPRPKEGTDRWANCAPDTIIVTATRELVEQTADVARRLSKLLPEKAQKEWKVAVALGAPPGVGKKLKRGNEQWPFPKGEGRPRVLVTTLEFISYFFHKRHVPFWSKVRYMVYDEVDRLATGPERKLLQRVKLMTLRGQRLNWRKLQTVLVAGTMPSQGTKSTLLRIKQWMPHALRALPRPDLLHRNHPLLLQQWNYVPEGFDGKVSLLVEYLKSYAHEEKESKKACVSVFEKTMIFCNDAKTAEEIAELLATTYHFGGVGLFVKGIGNDERRERMRMFRDGKIMIMVCTNLLMRGIDVPDVSRVVQFDFSRNVVDHMHRIGRVSRAGTRGRALNFYDDSEQGGRLLAEAVQKLGDRPLDSLFSRNRGFKRGLERTQAFKEMLLMQGLPLPKHLQDAGAEEEPRLLSSGETPRLEDVLEGLDVPIEDDEDESAFSPDDDEEDPILAEVAAHFETDTDEEKDKDFLQTLSEVSEEELASEGLDEREHGELPQRT